MLTLLVLSVQLVTINSLIFLQRLALRNSGSFSLKSLDSIEHVHEGLNILSIGIQSQGVQNTVMFSLVDAESAKSTSFC